MEKWGGEWGVVGGVGVELCVCGLRLSTVCQLQTLGPGEQLSCGRAPHRMSSQPVQ